MANSLYEESILCNILLIGKAASGKSCFANYLFNTNLFTASAGSPVPGWEAELQQYSFDSSGVTVNIYESVSLGDESSGQWPSLLDRFLTARKEIAADDAIPGNSLIHTLFYVVHGAGDALSPEEAMAPPEIKEICDRHGLSLSVAITHCDKAEEASIQAIEAAAKGWGLAAMRICSDNAHAKDHSEVDTRFGIEPALAQVLSASYAKVGRGISLYIISGTEKMMRAIQTDVAKRMKASKISIMRLSKVDTELAKVGKALYDEFLQIYTDEILPCYYTYFDFVDAFKASFKGKEELQGCLLEIEDALGIVDREHVNLMDIVVRAAPDRVLSTRKDMLKGVSSIAGQYLFLKSALGKCMDKIISLSILKLGKQSILLRFNDYL